MSRLEAVLSHYGVEVKPDRTTQLVLCPLGHESNASCSVNFDKGVWNCFSCGEAGDELTLIQKVEHCDFAASVVRLVEIAGEGDEPVRKRGGPRASLSGGKGYKPKYRRAVPPGVRRQP